ncbi:MAG: hypothetical protein K5648_01495 [Erysipelotrichaceae bacterium]|nr:hypothetical protein [Erysipelotrichaceae bacterium]
MKKDQEPFKTYYERKKMRKHSLFVSTMKTYVIILIMLTAWSPSFILPFFAYKLGVWWWILLILYCTLTTFLMYVVIRYRDIMGIRGYFDDEGFAKEFKNELWWIRIMDRIVGFRKYRRP